MIKNIVFDFGGVIADIDRDKAVQAFVKLGLKDAETRLDKYHQTGIFQELEGNCRQKRPGRLGWAFSQESMCINWITYWN